MIEGHANIGNITNILKHAHPQTIDICINEKDNKLQIIIIDDGISSDSSQWQANTGLCSLHTRAKEIKSNINWETLDVTSAWNKGTKLTITLPYMEK